MARKAEGGGVVGGLERRKLLVFFGALILWINGFSAPESVILYHSTDAPRGLSSRQSIHLYSISKSIKHFSTFLSLFEFSDQPSPQNNRMHYRVRRLAMDSSKQRIVKVGANNKEEEVDPKLQRLWEEETKQHSNEGPLFYLKRPKTAFLTDFVIEFVDLGCQYVFIVTNGIGQWFYEINPSKKGSQEAILPPNTSSVAHPFFREALIRGTVGMHENLTTLLLAGGQTSEWALCHQPRSHYHQVIKIYWNLELYSEDLKKAWESHEHPNIGHTTHLFCSNARLIDLFDALCGANEHEKDGLCLTDVPTYYDLARYNYMRAKDSDRPMIKMVIGKSYSYRQARIEQALVKELGWRTHSDGALWVIPSRWSWLENAAKTDAPITHNNEIDSCETELLPERDTKTKV